MNNECNSTTYSGILLSTFTFVLNFPLRSVRFHVVRTTCPPNFKYPTQHIHSHFQLIIPIRGGVPIATPLWSIKEFIEIEFAYMHLQV